MPPLLSLLVGDPVETLAVLTGIASVWLSARESLWSWPVGLVNVSLYFVVFLGARLYADTGLQVVYFALCLYGWWEWRFGGANRTPLPVSRIARATAVRLAVLVVAGGAALGTLLARLTDAAVPYVDSGVTATSLAAQWMLTRKHLEAWLVWIAVDVVYVGMFVARGLHRTAVLYAIFLVLATLGWRGWRRSLRRTEAGPPAAPTAPTAPTAPDAAPARAGAA